MKGIGKQEQTRDLVRLFDAEHARLSAAVGVASEEDAAGDLLPHRGNGILQALPVAGGIAGAGRAGRTGLAVGEIAAEDRVSGFGEGFCEDYKQWGLGV